MRSMVEGASALRQASRSTPLPPRKGHSRRFASAFSTKVRRPKAAYAPLPAIAGRDEGRRVHTAQLKFGIN